MSNETKNQAVVVEALRNLVGAVASTCNLADVGDAYYAGVELLKNLDHERALQLQAQPVLFVVDAFNTKKKDGRAAYAAFFADEAFMTKLDQIVKVCAELGLKEVRQDRGPDWGPEEGIGGFNFKDAELIVQDSGSFWFVAEVDATKRSGRIESLTQSLADIRQRLETAEPGEIIFISTTSVEALRAAYEEDNPPTDI